ncbi:FUSC family protein [Zunongwangia endophytica]|uniref:FUSC family membrane protein n=1 Tax=Zunongwangia endophytica TaxID=1808945 RepID=A0ABV8HCA8_9FLAO|nr:FUSC family membrane protein [Zunongwangia endophytica]MDN3594078.1 FUSC family membrane protein [Zunongwangia endophytica]
MNKRLSYYWHSILRFLRSTDFTKALILTLSIGSSIGIFNALGLSNIGVPMAVGCLLTAPSDTIGTLKHKIVGVVAAAILAGVTSLVLGFASVNIYLTLPILGIVVFAISYLAIYGFRASMVAFAGLMAVVLSFANVDTSMPLWQHCLLISAGGFWYLTLSLIWHYLNPKHETEQLLGQCLELTGEYLQVRSKLLLEVKERDNYQRRLFDLQNELNQKHESLREILISSRKISGNSNYTRKRLLIFIELIDILELGMANPVNYERMDALFKEDKKYLKMFSDVTHYFGEQLVEISKSIENKRPVPENLISDYIEKNRELVNQYRQSIDISEKREHILMLRNLFDYQERQSHKINTIFGVINNLKMGNNIFMKQKEALKFITPQEYSSKILVENFNFGSPIFRHALRLAIIVLVGFSIGAFFSIQNAYWILLTIVVIMRPNYGLTKSRTKERIIGTLIGGAIAVGIVFITQNVYVYGVLGLLSLTLAFSLIQRNYRTAAVFITLSIIFIYALMKPDVLEVIQFRIIDTMVGAVLAALGNLLLWPAWEAENIRNIIATSISANRNYFVEIDKFYHSKGDLPTSYKLSRKKAFLEMGNLSTAFQRMTQEPKSKQKDLGLIYRLVSLNQTFLSALASMGTYIRNHNTTDASEHFEVFVKQILHSLDNAEEGLIEQGEQKKTNVSLLKEAKSRLDEKYDDLVKIRNQEIAEGKELADHDMRLQLQEAQLITNQLQWLLDISKNIRKTVYKTTSI